MRKRGDDFARPVKESSNVWSINIGVSLKSLLFSGEKGEGVEVAETVICTEL